MPVLNMPGLSAEEVIALLGLQPHPEGGHFTETFRDNSQGGRDGGRGHSTAIYFLLRESEVSHWHRVADAAEVWHFYAGAPLELSMAQADAGPTRRMILGANLAAGERPQGVVPAGWWQAARSLGAWSLAGCTVAPGFDFAAFSLAPAGWKPSP